MKVATTAERLKTVMERCHYRQVDILEKCRPYSEKYNVKFGRNDLSQYVSGKVQPSQSKLTVLSLALGVSEVWLMGYDVDMERTPRDREPSPEELAACGLRPAVRKSFPVMEPSAGGEEESGPPEFETLMDAGDRIRADFCLTVKDDSMLGANIRTGDEVFIRKQSAVRNGEVAAVLIGERVQLKRVYFYPEKQKLMLLSENPAYEPAIYTEEEIQQVRVVGKAVAYLSLVR